MEKYLVLSLALFAWGAYAQTTDMTMETNDSNSDGLQTGMVSTLVPPSAVSETTSVILEVAELPSNTESAAEEERGITETEQPTPTQPISEEITVQQGNENNVSEIEERDDVSEGMEQQNSEQGIEEVITSALLPTEATMSQSTTSQPAVEEETTTQSPIERTTLQSAVQDITTQPSVQDTQQPIIQTDTTLLPALQDDATRQPTIEQARLPSTTQQETETERIPERENTQSTVDQDTSTSQDPPSSEPPMSTTIFLALEEQNNPIQRPNDNRTEPDRSAVEGTVVTSMIETEDNSSDLSTNEGSSQVGGSNLDDDLGKVETACPTDCATGIGDPICGSDQRVYESECHLKRDTCGKNVTVTSWELCRGKHDICPAQCLNIQDPVCGEDGKIYPNLCLMYKFNCGKRMRTYDLVRCVNTYRGFRRIDGACPKVCHELYRPVCGSDGKVYSNDCYLRLQTCGRNVQIVEMSQCVDTPRCPHTCTPLYDPVCGSDGRMYLNHCYFANLNCGKNIVKVDLRYCESFQHLK